MRNVMFATSFLLAVCFFGGGGMPQAQAATTYTLLPLTNTWRYNASGLELGTAWQASGYNDSAWPQGRGALGFEDNNAFTMTLTNTVLPLSNSFGVFITNFYFRTHFTLTNAPALVQLTTSNIVDDGAVFYINGAEYTRIRMTNGLFNAATFAQPASTEGVFSNVVIPANLLAQGDNVLAVEVHQSSAASSDIVFGMAILATTISPVPPTITPQPTNNIIFIGQNNTFSTSVTGPTPITNQWFRNGLPVPNATNAVLAQINVAGAQAGDYYLIAANPYGKTTSSVANLTVIGGDAVLRLLDFTNVWSYNASGSNLLTAWRGPLYDDSTWAQGRGIFAKSASTFPEPISTSLSLTNSPGNAVITYYFREHFNLPAGRTNVVLVTSNLIDDGAVFYLNGSEAGRLRLAGTVLATTLASGSPLNGTAYETLLLPATNLVAGANLLAVEVHQSSSGSPDVVFGMNLRAYPLNTEPLSILSQPQNQTGSEGQPASLFADVFGGQPVSYQWFKNGTPLAGATNATLLLPSLHATNAGGYSFIASNSVNSATSTVASVNVIADQTPPTLLAAFATNDFNSIVVVFSEPVDPATATNTALYAFLPPITIVSAQLLGPDRVLLVTSGRDVQFDYTLTISGVTDLADAPNSMSTAVAPVHGDARMISSGLLPQIKTVFIIVMENQDWTSIKGSANAPYMNSLLPQASYCERYRSHNSLHPSEPNYIWLEGGDNFGFNDDAGPAVDRISSTNHLATLLNNAGIDWRGYMEDMPSGVTGTNNAGPYAGRHNPFAFFDDVTTNFSYCTNHVRPYSLLAGDLAANRVGRYNFLTPNITNDMHDLVPGGPGMVRQGDYWLSHEVPLLTNSAAYQDNGAIFITWDESDLSTTNPCGMIVLSPLAKGNGYASFVNHDHSSTVCTMQTIFGVRPLLGDAANANTLGELFKDFTLTPAGIGANFSLTLNNRLTGKTNYVQASSDMLHWTTINTNRPADSSTVFDPDGIGHPQRFYRVIQAP